MVSYTKDDYEHMARLRTNAFRKIAERLGENHAITKMMGTLAWGRHNAEHGPDFGLREAIEGKAYLDGYFGALNLWARDNDGGAQRVMLDCYPRGYESIKK